MGFCSCPETASYFFEAGVGKGVYPDVLLTPPKENEYVNEEVVKYCNLFIGWQWGQNFSVTGTYPDPPTFSEGDIRDLSSFVAQLNQRSTALSVFLREHLSKETLAVLAADPNPSPDHKPTKTALVQNLNIIITEQTLYDKERFTGIKLRIQTQQLLDQNPQGNTLVCLNRMLLEDAYPQELWRTNYPERLSLSPLANLGGFVSWLHRTDDRHLRVLLDLDMLDIFVKQTSNTLNSRKCALI